MTPLYTSDSIIVSRHPAAIQFIREELDIHHQYPVMASVTEVDVKFKRIIGNVPMKIAEAADHVVTIEFDGDPPRGQEYSVEDMRAAGARLAVYYVTKGKDLPKRWQIGD